MGWKNGVLLAILLVALQGVQADDSPPLFLAGPEGATRKDMDTCAKAMTSRCNAYAYEGVTFRAIEVKDGNAKEGTILVLEVSCPTGVTDKMSEKILAFAGTPCKEAVLRFERKLSEREAEQFDLAKGTAPKGARWTKIRAVWDSGREQTVLLKESPIVNMIGNATWHRKGEARTDGQTPESAHIQLSPAASRTISSQAGDSGEPLTVYFIVDGIARQTGGDFSQAKGREGEWSWYGQVAEDEILGLSLNNPMPFALTRAAPKQVK